MSDSARLFYKIVGHGADTIIAIHGGPGLDLESIAGDFAVLGARHTVIFYDQRGGGKSTLPTDTSTLAARRQVQDLDELRRHFGLSKVTLVAHSYGPLLAASYALAHPSNVSRMVFFGPVPPRRGDFWQRFGESLGKRIDERAGRGPGGGLAADDQRRRRPTTSSGRRAGTTGRSASVRGWRSPIGR